MNYVNELLPDLMLQAPDVSDTALKRFLQLGVQDLFGEHDLWVQELPPMMLFDGVDQYVVRVPTGTRIARIEWVKLDGKPLAPLDKEDITENLEAGYHITNDEPHRLLVTDKTQRGDLTLYARLYPTPKTEELPDWLIHDFRTAMVNAGLMKVYASPGSPWFDPSVAMLLGQQINAAVLTARRRTENRKRGKRRVVRYGGIA